MQWTSSGVLDDEKALPVLLDNARVIVGSLTFQKGNNLWSNQVIMHINNAYHSPVPPLSRATVRQPPCCLVAVTPPYDCFLSMAAARIGSCHDFCKLCPASAPGSVALYGLEPVHTRSGRIMRAGWLGRTPFSIP